MIPAHAVYLVLIYLFRAHTRTTSYQSFSSPMRLVLSTLTAATCMQRIQYLMQAAHTDADNIESGPLRIAITALYDMGKARHQGLPVPLYIV